MSNMRIDNGSAPECRMDTDCLSILRFCSAVGACVDRTPSCTKESDCRAGSHCSGNICLEEGVCYFNFQCQDGYECEDYRCSLIIDRCSSDGDCPLEQICEINFGTCRETPCSDDSACTDLECCDTITGYCVDKLICERFEQGIPANCNQVDELCDQIDNDCDRAIDEDFPKIGTSCEVGTGICYRVGHLNCKPDGTGTTCDVTSGAPESEVCDGLDNNCNGVTDEGCPL